MNTGWRGVFTHTTFDAAFPHLGHSHHVIRARSPPTVEDALTPESGCGGVFNWCAIVRPPDDKTCSITVERKLTKIGQTVAMESRVIPRLIALACAPIAALSLAACAEEQVDAPVQVVGQDPLLSRALNDPLMVDPDLAWRNEANAVITFRDGHPLPPFEARDDAANRAREAARLELLENGQIPALPAASSAEGSASLADLNTAGEIVKAVGGREDCIGDLDGDLQWSTAMPPTSSIMPHGMVQQAAGVDQGTCVVRVVRYLTPVSIDDALEYHFTKADRERFRMEIFASPEMQLRGERRDQQVAVHVRAGPSGMTEIDVVHWRK